MVRSVLAVIAGILVGGIVVGLCEVPGFLLHPPPAGFDSKDAEQLKAHFARAPLAAHIGVAVAWTLGSLVGSLLAAWIARRAFFTHGMIVACAFLAAVVLNLRSFPHPTWLAVLGVVAPLAMGWLGSLLAERIAGRPPTGPQPRDMRSGNMAC
jgi:hypothetical protein